MRKKYAKSFERRDIMAGEFGKFIAEKRLEKDVKLKPIAERLGVSVTYLSDIIKGIRKSNVPSIKYY